MLQVAGKILLSDLQCDTKIPKMKSSVLILLLLINTSQKKMTHGKKDPKKPGLEFVFFTSSTKTYKGSISAVDNEYTSSVSYIVAEFNSVANETAWFKAQNYCRNINSELVTVDNEEKNQLLIKTSEKQEFWIGMHRNGDQWQWSNQDKVTYTNWKRDFFCAFVHSDGSWNDSVCHDSKEFMCYRQTSNISERFVLINEKMNWSTAQNFCQVHYKDLVSIRNKSENEEILRNAKGTSFWIGLFNNPWKWSDGGNITFQNWEPKQPDNFNRNEACVEIFKNGRWNDNICKKQLNFSCFNRSSVSTSYYFVPNSLSWQDSQKYCSENYTDLVTIENETVNQQVLALPGQSCGWIGLHRENDKWAWSNGDPLTFTNWKREFFCAVLQSDGSWNDSDCSQEKPFMCYNETNNFNRTYIWINESMNWNKAQNYCQVNYRDLVSIRNETENMEIIKKAQITPFWIGLFNNPWKWSDGGKSTYQNWENSQPNNYKHHKKCVEVKNNGTWSVDDCNSTKPFICSKIVMNVTFINTNSTWEDAVDYCREKNSDLISISSKLEQDAIAALVNITGSSSVWLGLRQSRLFGFWFWIDEKPLSYEKWLHGPPSQLPALSSCAVMSQEMNFSWTNVPCSEKYRFICRYQ
ncbi:macrophage mannose receptor 1-like isoform X2 [Polypterus senegalus]|uniref:macrophage mannose receptor 1-like isoform X2 n=1 Tax=Polypterus senegalus TaxID=55291 RepID=UPI001963DFFC|nr:macrophage mannose receptor 1-like isoform X2 [Polypterus senegalus]